MNRVVAVVPRLSQQARLICVGRVTLQEKADLTHLKKEQDRFQIEDGKPIYLKGGFADQMLYSFTVLMCVIGVGYAGNMLYGMAMPPKN